MNRRLAAKPVTAERPVQVAEIKHGVPAGVPQVSNFLNPRPDTVVAQLHSVITG